LWLIIYYPDVLWCILDKCLEKIFLQFLLNFQTKNPHRL
jgi:hypothetical protein